MLGRTVIVIVLNALCGAVSAQVYRCTDGLGAVSYQDTPCGKTQQLVVVPGGDKPAPKVGLRKAEKAWLRELQKRSRVKPKPVKRKTADRKSQDKTCWSKRQRLDEVRARLRRGYKASQGEALRRKRRAYEDYLFRYCD